MTYHIEFSPEARQDLAQLDKVVAERILRKLRWLSENFDILTPETLSGEWKDLFKLRVGSYRVIYTVNYKEQLLTIHLVGHRRDIYKPK